MQAGGRLFAHFPSKPIQSPVVTEVDEAMKRIARLPRGLPHLHLAHKLLLAFTVVIAVVVSLVSWNLFIADRLVKEQRTILQRAIPAVRLEVELLDGVAALQRLEGRYVVLRDRAYRKLFQDRAAAMDADLARLVDLLSTPEERKLLDEGRERLAAYGRSLAERRPLPAGDAHPATQLEATLNNLYQQSGAELNRLEATAEALNEQSRLVSIAALVATILVGLLISLYAALRIARPLRKLQSATQAVARREFSAAIPVHGRDEVAELTISFNQMAAELKHLDNLKDAFFAAISHDLRTPLSGVSMSAEVLRSEAPGPLTPQQARLIEIVCTSSARLLGLVNQILDLGSMKAGKLKLDLRQTDLRRVIEASLNEIRPLAEERKLELRIDAPNGLPKIIADESRIHQVLVNLLGNSIKFTGPGGTISVSAGLGPGEVVVRVADNGIGIPPDLLLKIFEQYEQAHTGRGGTGIGLTVVKGFVEAHGGRVWVESEEGQGTCFGFTLPLQQPAA